MKYIIAIALLFQIAYAKNIEWFTNLDNASNFAKKKHLPITVFLYSNSCKYCLQTVNNFTKYGGKTFLSSRDSMVMVAINSKDKDQQKKHSLYTSSFPTFFLLDENLNRTAKPLKGYVDFNQLIAYLHKYSVWYKKTH